MRKYIQYLLWACLCLVVGTSCENEDFLYQDEARVRMEGPSEWTLDTDSLEFSFVSYPDTVTEMVMNVTLHVIGYTMDYDRTAAVAVVADKTTATPDLYELPDSVTIPAGQNQGICPVVLKRAPVLEETPVRLYLQVVPSADFAPGVMEQDHLLLKWNDIISRPSNWDDLEEFFGTYSDAKYRFILNNTGVTKFDTDEMSWAKLNNYRLLLINALNEYNAAHPDSPILDENTGLPISFDN